ncbi:MAG TPA: cupin domain-containing protein [Ramlibacter sp.]
MDIHQPTPLLGGLSPAKFMRRHWQKKPLLVRGALPGVAPLLSRSQLFALAQRDGVESRLVMQDRARWQMKRGPFARRALPPVAQRKWTLLVQGVDLHDDRAHTLQQQFAFVPQARLDDLMISWASDGGGVGPHFDSYDVFLLQVQGRRRWRIGRQADLTLRADAPLKILANFEPEEEHVLEPGDMLYLPPRWAHDGIAQGECQTYSIGFRAPSRGELARELLERMAEDAADAAGEAIYRDAKQHATAQPGAVPHALREFARDAMKRALGDKDAFDRALGEYLTEPKADVWFDAGEGGAAAGGIVLDRRTRMMYDARHVFINGDGLRASGRDAKLMQALADSRTLSAKQLRHASGDARDAIASWLEAGWAHPLEE